MKWSHATGLLVTLTTIAAGGVWAGCSSNDNGNDAGTDGGGSDVAQQKDTGTTDSGGNDSGGGDASDGGGIAVDASALDCTYYCASIMQVCNATSNKQYVDNATCLSMCANIANDAGAGATSGDSLACRMYHLSVAAQQGNADTHCPHAGPYGYGVCGSLCNDFCNQDFATAGPCKGNNYPSRDVCNTYCAGAAGADASAGAPGNAAGSPSMLCREYHLEAAYQSGTAAPHCPHAGEDGGGVCQ